MAAPDRRPLRWPVLLLLLVVGGVALWQCDLDFSTLLSSDERGRALERLGSLLRAVAHPSFEPGFLHDCLRLLLDTAATATLGTLLAVLISFFLALLASRNVVVGDARGPSRWLRVGLCESSRVTQDLLRGVPDFAWAVVLVGIIGLGPPAGVIAIGLNVAGILGRVWSELFDAVPARALEPLRQAGASRLQAFFYGVMPAVAQDGISFGLLRWECAMRNATVIGAVGGGGLGNEVKLALDDGVYERVVPLLLCLLLLTIGSDALSQVLRSRLRHDPDHPSLRETGALTVARQRSRFVAAGLVVTGAAIASAWWLAPAFAKVVLGTGLHETWDIFKDLLAPDLSWKTVRFALEMSVQPFAIAIVATAAAALGAAVLAYGASWTFQRLGPAFGAGRGGVAGAVVLATCRAIAVVARAIPDVCWALMLISILRLGTLAAVVAVAIHTLGLLVRLFCESVDGLPLRRLEPVQAVAGSRPKTYLYAAVPSVAPHWIANSFFQLEANVRASIVLGMVGAAEGLGFKFHTAFEMFRLPAASTLLLAMLLWALVLDRLSRALGFARARLAG